MIGDRTSYSKDRRIPDLDDVGIQSSRRDAHDTVAKGGMYMCTRADTLNLSPGLSGSLMCETHACADLCSHVTGTGGTSRIKPCGCSCRAEARELS